LAPLLRPAIRLPMNAPASLPNIVVSREKGLGWSSAGCRMWFRAAGRADVGGFHQVLVGATAQSILKTVMRGSFSRFCAIGTALELYPASTRQQKGRRKRESSKCRVIRNSSKHWSRPLPQC
jgi:hypothetical protein